jgi:uncharacterized protein
MGEQAAESGWVRRPASTGRRLARLGGLLLLCAPVAYIGLGTALCLGQDWLIFPGRASQGFAMVPEPRAAEYELVSLTTADGTPIKAVFGAAAEPDGAALSDPRNRPTLLFLYGNGSSVSNVLWLFQAFRRQGINVLIPEYPGYGMSGGTASEAGCYEAARVAHDHLLARPDVDPDLIVIGGWSLGGAVAIDLAAQRPAAGLAVIASFTSMHEMARRRSLPGLPVNRFLRHRFDSVSKLPAIDCPLFLAHGRRDLMIPFEMMDELAAVCPTPTVVHSVDTGGHDDIFNVEDRALVDALSTFVHSVRVREDGLP